jgi:putative membrane protein
MTAEQKDKRLFVNTIILVVVHLAGIIGISFTHYCGLFLQLSSFNLLLSTVLLFLNHKDFSKSFYIFCVTIFLAGFFIEVFGVHTRMIFGDYSYYGSFLGLQFLNVPLIIGINWLVLIYTIGSILNNLRTSIFIKSISGATALVILDFLIEPVAIKYNFWDWYEGFVPLQNYIAWFIVSFAFLIFFYKLHFNKENPLAKALFIIQLVFFTLLRIL